MAENHKRDEFELLCKMMGMTNSDNDHQALVALRKANALAQRLGGWPDILGGRVKITVIADPFGSIKPPPPPPSRPAPPRPAPTPQPRPQPAPDPWAGFSPLWGDTYAIKDELKAYHGARFDTTRKVWMIPDFEFPAAQQRLAEYLRQKAPPPAPNRKFRGANASLADLDADLNPPRRRY